MDNTRQLFTEFNFHEERPLFKLSTILYEDERFLTHAIARKYGDLFREGLIISWQLDF